MWVVHCYFAQYLELETIRFRGLVASFFGESILVLLCVFAGLVMYAVYRDCDPKLDGKIISDDQVNLTSTNFFIGI